MSRRFKTFLFLLLTSSIFSQKSEDITLYFNVPPLQNFQIIHTKSFPNMTFSDYERGYYEITDAVTIRISSNVEWQLVIYSTRSNLYTTQGIFKPISDFSVCANNHNFFSMSQVPQVIYTGKAGVHDMEIMLDYRMKIDVNSTPAGNWIFDPVIRLEPLN